MTHACGHDGHIVIMLGFISWVKNNLDKLPSNLSIQFIFQPGEEGCNGAKEMIQQGCTLFDEV